MNVRSGNLGVGETRFELATLRSQSECATGLRHSPVSVFKTDSKNTNDSFRRQILYEFSLLISDSSCRLKLSQLSSFFKGIKASFMAEFVS